MPASPRETLFGDLPLEQWPPAGADVEAYPWSAFATARTALAAGDPAAALACWREIATRPELESRHYLQAWHFLREHGGRPSPEDEKRVLGVVVEIAVDAGLELLAAYVDHSARYYDHTGGGVVWEHPDGTLDALIDELLDASGQIVRQIGPWEQERPPAPPPGQVRLSFLTPSGLHFGQAPLPALAADPMAGGVLQAAVQVRKGLVAKTR